jgi:hypothetical protein
LPIAAIAALITITGAWPVVFGGAAAPVVPRWTGWTSPALLIVAQACGVVAIGLVVTAISSTRRPVAVARPAEPPPLAG